MVLTDLKHHKYLSSQRDTSHVLLHVVRNHPNTNSHCYPSSQGNQVLKLLKKSQLWVIVLNITTSK